MKFFRTIGSLAFVIGLFTAFVGGLWQVYHEPALPWWLKIAIYCLLGGILLVLLTVALEHAEVPGSKIAKVLGLVKGHTIYAIWIGKDLSAIVRLVLGGELVEYTEMMGKARIVASNRMIAQAEELGADAVINVRFVTTSVIGSAAELLAYGTAVKLKKAKA